jgi:hypothetical protein
MSLIRCTNNPEGLYIWHGGNGINITCNTSLHKLTNLTEDDDIIVIPWSTFKVCMNKFYKTREKVIYKGFTISEVDVHFGEVKEVIDPWSLEVLCTKILKEWFYDAKKRAKETGDNTFDLYKEYKSAKELVRDYKKSQKFKWVSYRGYMKFQKYCEDIHTQIKFKYKGKFVYMWPVTFSYIYHNMEH